MLQLQQHAAAILTDSGGMQKEAYWLGVPCVTLREETEWGELVAVGANKLCGHDSRNIVEAVEAFAKEDVFTPSADGGSLTQRDLYGDGKTAARIVNLFTGV